MTSTRETIRPATEAVRQPTQTALPPQAAEGLALETVLEAIRRDCQVQPARYLEETLVPFGGE